MLKRICPPSAQYSVTRVVPSACGVIKPVPLRTGMVDSDGTGTDGSKVGRANDSAAGDSAVGDGTGDCTDCGGRVRFAEEFLGAAAFISTFYGCEFVLQLLWALASCASLTQPTL